MNSNIIRTPTPKFGINEVVYLKESAMLGYLEAVKVYNIYYDRDVNKNMYVFVHNKSSPSTQIAGDAIDLKRNRAIAIVEEELLTYQEALNIKLRALEREIGITNNQLASAIGYPEINIVIQSTDEDIGINFGEVAIGSSIEKVYTINNDGDRALELTGSSPIMVLGDDDFKVVSQPSRIIEPGGYVNFTLRFSPSVEGRILSVILVVNNDPNNAIYNFAVEGIGII